MQQRSPDHHAKQQHRVDPAANAPVRMTTFERTPHKLIDAPPYSDIYLTANGFEAVRPEAHKKVRVVDYDQEAPEYGKAFNRKRYEEDVDAEADEFIKIEHEKFKLSKWLSSFFGG